MRVRLSFIDDALFDFGSLFLDNRNIDHLNSATERVVATLHCNCARKKQRATRRSNGGQADLMPDPRSMDLARST